MHQYGEHRGYLPLGADLINGTMTVDAAKHLCNSMASCMGFTLSAAVRFHASCHNDAHHDHRRARPCCHQLERTRQSRHVVWLKSADEWIENNNHVTFLKKAPDCPVEIKRYKKARHGPYCCEGAACPEEDEYGALEQTFRARRNALPCPSAMPAAGWCLALAQPSAVRGSAFLQPTFYTVQVQSTFSDALRPATVQDAPG